ncbi:MAG: glycosyltransferase involved in cell wall biosynthesis [bacterium]|jgi:glycosyltransferase involved in cell wall biosynthesis
MYMINKPKITLVLGTYKVPELIKPTLEGFLNQTYKDFIVFVVDDNSPADVEIIQKSKSIVESFNDPRIHYIKNDVNIGVPHVIRKWINLVNTEYFYICGAGDKLYPNALELMVSFLEKNQKASMVHGLEIKPNGSKDIPLFDNTGSYDAKIYLKSHLNDLGKSKIYSWSQCSAVFRTELFKIWNIPVKPFHFWDYYFHCTYLLHSKEVGFIKELLTIRNNDSEDSCFQKLNDFTGRIERLHQALEFIKENKSILIARNHKVYNYTVIIKSTLLYYSFRQNLSFSESLFCLEKIFSSNLLFPVVFILNIFIIPLKIIFLFLKFIKRSILKF